MALLIDIVTHCNELLAIDHFKDYCPNGLQIEGKSEINRIVSGVTASQALIDAAIGQHADLILVHHGYFWRGEHEAITGIKKSRIASLIKNDISLLAYHLPLDAHATLGNNAQLAQKLNLEVVDVFGNESQPVGVIARPLSSVARQAFANKVYEILGRQPVILSASRLSHYKKIAICTGAAQNYFESAIDAGADVFLTGEVSEQSYHLAMESGVDFYSAGHHATERYGVQALGEYLAKQFKLSHEYCEIANPI